MEGNRLVGWIAPWIGEAWCVVDARTEHDARQQLGEELARTVRTIEAVWEDDLDRMPVKPACRVCGRPVDWHLSQDDDGRPSPDGPERT